MYTSNFANVRRIPEGLYPVAISIGIPKWYQGRRDQRLAPTWYILRQPRERYDEMMWARLKKLDARKVYE
ncbi:MAG: hypothetical protein K6T83_14375, partial [Alicyclobacillus sp.]|nr:hypothetical protein [Alicyclobacillus sp.]